MTIKDIFDSMAYGPAPESAAEALAWLTNHNHAFGHWIDGAFTKPGQTFPTSNPANGKHLINTRNPSSRQHSRVHLPIWRGRHHHNLFNTRHFCRNRIHQNYVRRPSPLLT